MAESLPQTHSPGLLVGGEGKDGCWVGQDSRSPLPRALGLPELGALLGTGGGTLGRAREAHRWLLLLAWHPSTFHRAQRPVCDDARCTGSARQAARA